MCQTGLARIAIHTYPPWSRSGMVHTVRPYAPPYNSVNPPGYLGGNRSDFDNFQGEISTARLVVRSYRSTSG